MPHLKPHEILAAMELVAERLKARPSFTNGLVPMCRPSLRPPCARWCSDAARADPKPCGPVINAFMREVEET